MHTTWGGLSRVPDSFPPNLNLPLKKIGLSFYKIEKPLKITTELRKMY